MTITEDQRRTLDLMAESAGWNWSDVEDFSRAAFDECVAGLSEAQADELMQAMADADSMAAVDEEAMHDCDKEYRIDCARCNGVSPMDAGCW